MRFNLLANFLGLPSTTFPVGAADGLPVAMMLTGRWWEEALLLRLANAGSVFTRPARFYDAAPGQG